jgi:Protein of unknown function (DUF3124)
VEVYIPVSDLRGGTGADFVVDWAATGKIAEPVIEAFDAGRRRQRELLVHQPWATDQDRRRQGLAVEYESVTLIRM